MRYVTLVLGLLFLIGCSQVDNPVNPIPVPDDTILEAPGDILYQDDFESGLDPGWNFFEGGITTWGIVNDGGNNVLGTSGTLGGSGPALRAWIGQIGWTNYEINCRLKCQGTLDDDIRIVFYNDGTNDVGYILRFGDTRIQFHVKIMPDVNTELWNDPDVTGVASNTWFDVNVTVYNGTIECFVNGRQLGTTVNDTQISGGFIEFGSELPWTASNGEIYLDDLVVTEYAAGVD